MPEHGFSFAEDSDPKIMPPDGKCRTCHWYVGFRAHFREGVCKHNPPTVYQGKTIWPEVNTSYDFCDQFDFYGKPEYNEED